MDKSTEILFEFDGSGNKIEYNFNENDVFIKEKPQQIPLDELPTR